MLVMDTTAGLILSDKKNLIQKEETLENTVEPSRVGSCGKALRPFVFSAYTGTKIIVYLEKRYFLAVFAAYFHVLLAVYLLRCNCHLVLPYSHVEFSQQKPCPTFSGTTPAVSLASGSSVREDGSERYSHLLHWVDMPRCGPGYTCEQTRNIRDKKEVCRV